MHSIIRDEHGRLVPVVRPEKLWQAASVKRSRDRIDRIAHTRKQRKAWLATTQWMNELDRQAISQLEATGIPWTAVQSWLDELEPREASAARRAVKQVLHMLVDAGVPLRERFEARNELYRRLISSGVMD